MRNIEHRLGAALALLALLAAPALGQYGSREDDFALFGGPGGGAQVRDPNGNLRTIKVGERIKVKGSSLELVVGEDGLVLPIGASITINGAPATTVRPVASRSFALYPLTVFSIGGRLRLSDNSLSGGTRSVVGSVAAFNYVGSLRADRRYELGAFYFTPYSGDEGDLYQVAGRYYFNPRFGAQLAYLDTTKGRGNTGAASMTYHALFDISSGGAVGSDRRGFSTQLGVGLLNNLSREYQVSTNRSVSRSTVNFSTFVDIGYTLTPRLSLNVTEWFVRDRNADINRLSLGAAYRF